MIGWGYGDFLADVAASMHGVPTRRSVNPRSSMATRQSIHPRMGALPPRYSFILNPYQHERFTRCPTCEASTRLRKIPLVVHVDDPSGPRLILLNKSCRLCVRCDTLVVHQAELARVIIAAGLSAVEASRCVVLGTVDRRTWREGFVAGVQPADVRAHMADFKAYVKVRVTPAHWSRSIPDHGIQSEREHAREQLRADVPEGLEQLNRGDGGAYDQISGRALAQRIKSRGRAARAKQA